ncbi:uncharacterized protein TNCV_3304401 [Trichonephila clavipes]|nr:uncharacterized protein TNCV_3304401 [Trichonephila clavipes]
MTYGLDTETANFVRSWFHRFHSDAFAIENVDKITEMIEIDRYVNSCSITQEGCGSPVGKVSDHGRHVMSSSPVSLKTLRVGQRCTLDLSRAQMSSRGVVVRRGGAISGVSLSLDHGSKLRGPSPKVLV